jgi:macrolide transport system ATP-binding/permease protein
METLIRDIKYGARFMIRAPGFALAAIVSLGLGIGANTAIFSLLDALLLTPMPVAQPDRIAAIYTSDFSSTKYGSSSYPDFQDFRERGNAVTDIAAYRITPVSMNATGESEMAFIEAVSGNYFSMLGVGAATGRLLGEADDRPGAAAAAVISYGLWTHRFASDPAVVGRTVQFNGRPFTIVGVAAREYAGGMRGLSMHAWIPMLVSRDLSPGERANWIEQRGSRGLMLLGRLRPGVSVEQAQAAFDVVAAQLYAAYPQQWRTIRGSGRAISVVAERDARLHPDVTGPVAGFMAVLMVVVGLVLLTACANVANLLLARAAARTREIGVRLALGSSRARLIRQLLTENVLLAASGGVLGVVVAKWLMSVLMSFKPPVPVPVGIELRLDPSVLIFTLVLSVVTGLVFGLAPAWQASKTDIVPVLKDEAALGRTRRSRLRSAFVVAQVACSMFLLVGAGLFVRSLLRARTIDAGFDPSNMIVMAVLPEIQGYNEPRGRALYESVVVRVSAVPGVDSATLAEHVPLGIGGSRRGTAIEGYQPQPGEDTETAYNVVGPRYFETMRIPIVRGRSFTEADRAGAPPVAIVNEAFARRYWPNADPLGKRISANGSDGPFREVIGVTPTGKYNTLGEEPRPFYYLPLWQEYHGTVTLHVKTAGDPRALIPSVREAVRAVDAAVPVFDVKTMDEQVLVALLPARLAGTLLGAFGLLALLLASVGIYGVMAYSVVQRTKEIGVRRALGAQTGNLLRLVFGEGMRLAAIGFAIGLAAAFALTRFAASLLYGITPTDPVTFIGALGILAAAALVACYIPALRALKVDPVTALRYE